MWLFGLRYIEESVELSVEAGSSVFTWTSSIVAAVEAAAARMWNGLGTDEVLSGICRMAWGRAYGCRLAADCLARLGPWLQSLSGLRGFGWEFCQQALRAGSRMEEGTHFGFSPGMRLL